MPVYYFHLRNGEDLLLDPDGRQLACVQDVASSALKEARSLISGDALEGHIDLAYRIDVQDVSGNTVHSLPFGDAVAIAPG